MYNNYIKASIVYYFLLFIFFTSVILTISCNSTAQKEKILTQKQIESEKRELEILRAEENQTNHIEPFVEPKLTKFVYVVIKTYEPRLELKEVKDFTPEKPKNRDILSSVLPEEINAPVATKYVKTSVTEYYYYTSDIIEISDFSEEKLYKSVDLYEKKIEKSVDEANRKIQFQNNYMRGEYLNVEAKIISKENHVFNSYKEASIQREENKQ